MGYNEQKALHADGTLSSEVHGDFDILESAGKGEIPRSITTRSAWRIRKGFTFPGMRATRPVWWFYESMLADIQNGDIAPPRAAWPGGLCWES